MNALAPRQQYEYLTPSENKLSVVLSLDAVDHWDVFSQNRRYLIRLLEASVSDLLALCTKIPALQPYICSPRPWASLRCFGVPLLLGSAEDFLFRQHREAAGLVIAADAPTLPPGYLWTAAQAIQSGACATIFGATESGWYLHGWGSGTATLRLPLWYRLSESDGLSRVRHDQKRGTQARATAMVLEQTPCQESDVSAGQAHHHLYHLRHGRVGR